MKSYSQAGQDRFCYEVLGRPENGTFLDIGANNPIDINNTFALEQMGWRGLLADTSEESRAACRKQRPNTPFLWGNAVKMNWNLYLDENFHWDGASGRVVDYLSLDIDEATECALDALLDADYRFCCITVEHDAYRFGEDRRDRMVSKLKEHGYDILCADVCDQGMSFEIWAVDPKLVDMKLAERFRCDKPTDWKEFFK
jgi:hypothetical protein